MTVRKSYFTQDFILLYSSPPTPLYRHLITEFCGSFYQNLLLDSLASRHWSTRFLSPSRICVCNWGPINFQPNIKKHFPQGLKNKKLTAKESKACHAMPPAVDKCIVEIPRVLNVSNSPCPKR